MSGAPVALGLDFGTESARAVLVDLEGRERGSGVSAYASGQILDALPTNGVALPPDYALQDPRDWIESGAAATRAALAAAGLPGELVVGIGVDFTSCTMLPTFRDGTPLCLAERWAGTPLAWPKLWKHHGAKAETDRINAVARERGETWLRRYGGVIGLEWFFPKILETLNKAPEVYDASEVWIEAGDWFVWRLVGGAAEDAPRSTCQAGYKAMWGGPAPRPEGGYPSPEFFEAVDPRLADIEASRLPGRFLAPGTRAGRLTGEMAGKFGLPEGVPVSAAIIDAHAGVPGAGVSGPGALVMVLGTSACHMLNAEREVFAPGIAGIVPDGILPGLVGYETGQAAVGDAFEWVRRATGSSSFDELSAAAAEIPPGSDGVLALDWLNGCRTPLMDGTRRGAFLGLTLRHGPAHLYRAMVEATACGARWIVDLLEEHGVPIESVVATGGIPHRDPNLVRIYADTLNRPVRVPAARHGSALGAAILGALAAGSEATGFRSTREAIERMAGPGTESGRTAFAVEPGPAAAIQEDVYRKYRAAAEWLRTGP